MIPIIILMIIVIMIMIMMDKENKSRDGSREILGNVFPVPIPLWKSIYLVPKWSRSGAENGAKQSSRMEPKRGSGMGPLCGAFEGQMAKSALFFPVGARGRGGGHMDPPRKRHSDFEGLGNFCRST